MGFLVCGALMLAGYVLAARSPADRPPVPRSPADRSLGGTLIIGLIASLAFGSTAIATLSAIGGSTPLIYTFFAGALVLAAAARRSLWHDLGVVFGEVRPAWVLCVLTAYALIGAILFPRLFLGETTVFVVAPEGGVVEAMLAPVSGNITQPGYLAVGTLTAIALWTLLLREDRLEQVRRGFLLLCLLHTGMGLLDFAGKNAGVSDVLAPLRTASYVMLSEQVSAGFARVNGAFPEPSSFSAASLTCLAFCYTYWRHTGDRLTKWLSALLLILLLVSTSTTAYGGLFVLGAGAAWGIFRALLTNRLRGDDLRMLALLAAGAVALVALALYREAAFDPVIDLVHASILDKAGSESGQGRAYWNIKSIQAFFDTSMLGVGMGSSRASSWPVAVLSQLGLAGTLLMALLLVVTARGLGSLEWLASPRTVAIVASVRAAALASIVAASMINGTPDPGLPFIIALVTITAVRARLLRERALERPSFPTWSEASAREWSEASWISPR